MHALWATPEVLRAYVWIVLERGRSCWNHVLACAFRHYDWLRVAIAIFVFRIATEWAWREQRCLQSCLVHGVSVFLFRADSTINYGWTRVETQNGQLAPVGGNSAFYILMLGTSARTVGSTCRRAL